MEAFKSIYFKIYIKYLYNTERQRKMSYKAGGRVWSNKALGSVIWGASTAFSPKAPKEGTFPLGFRFLPSRTQRDYVLSFCTANLRPLRICYSHSTEIMNKKPWRVKEPT